MMLYGIGLFETARVDDMLGRIEIYDRQSGRETLYAAEIIFEAVPETLDAKREAFTLIGTHAAVDAIIASITSTILSDDLAPMVKGPERFLNAHWISTAFLVPLVELSPANGSSSDVTEALKALLESIGKILSFARRARVTPSRASRRSR